MFISRPKIVHGENMLTSKVIKDSRVRGTANLVASSIITLTTHTSDVLSVAFSSTVLATCSADKTIRLWGTQDFTELPCSPLIGHEYKVNCCDFSPLGSLLVTCSHDGTLRLWDTETWEPLATLSHNSSYAIRVCSFSRDGSMIVTGGDDDSACLWNVQERKLIKCFKGHEESVTAVAFTPDGNYIVTGSSGGDMCGELLVWDAQFGHGKSLTRVQNCHDLGVLCCQFSPTYGSAGNLSEACLISKFLLATGGLDNLIKLWYFNCEVGSVNVSVSLDTMLPGHQDSVLWLCFSPNGKYIASGSLDKTARLWNVETKQAVISIDEHSSYVASCAFSVDNKFLATASNDCTVKVWQLTDTSPIMHNLNGYEKGKETPTNRCSPQVTVESWNVDCVCDWLKSLGFDEHENKFRAHAIDGKTLLSLTSIDLITDLEIAALGHRKKILRERDALAMTLNKTVKSDRTASPEFFCPITHEVMKDPVVAADGYTYDRLAIVSWIEKERRSPLTNVPLTSTEVTPNRNLKMLIQRFQESS